MPNRDYNKFGLGLQDIGSGFVDGKNIDGDFFSYGATLGPKVNKGILTDGVIGCINGDQKADGGVETTLVGGEGGKLYKLDGTDYVEAYTLSGGWDIRAIFSGNSDFYILYENGNDIDVAEVSHSDVESNTISGNINETYISGQIDRYSTGYTPILPVGGDNILTGGASGRFFQVNLGTQVVTEYTFISGVVVGFSDNGSTFTIYDNYGYMYGWSGGDTYNWKRYIGSRIQKVSSSPELTYILTEDGKMYSGDGLSIPSLVSEPRTTNRLDDNSDFFSIMDFSDDTGNIGGLNKNIYTANGDIYVYCSDKVKGIVKLSKGGLNKVICQNHEGIDIDYVYDMWYYERNLKRLYFSYKAGSSYGVDYIDLEGHERTTSGYLITEVFQADTTYKKIIESIRVACGYVHDANSISIYYRIENGDWEPVITINEDEAPLNYIKPIKTAVGETFKRYRDRQYKIVFTNGNGDKKPPRMGTLTEIYDVDNK